MSLQKKFLIPTIILVIALGMYLRIYWAPKLVEFIQDEEISNIRSHLQSVSTGLVPLLLENQLANVYDNLDAVLESNPSWKHILLYDANNRLLYPFKEPLLGSGNPSEFTLEQAVQVFDDRLGYLRLVVDLTASTNKLNDLQTRLNIALIIGMVLFIFGIYTLVNYLIYEPLNQISHASHKMSLGQFNVRLPRQSNDEIGALIRSFSDMRDSIEQYQHELRKEITEHKNTAFELYKQKEHATYQALHDVLTGLYNRREFETQLADAIDESHIHGSYHALVYMDLDQFKVVNDTCGHIAGDALLKQLTSLLSHRIRDTDVLARLGGDEFGLLLRNCPAERAKSIALDISNLIQEFRFEWQGNIFRVGVSMGLVPITPSSDDLTALLSAADTACYTAKDMGRNKIHIFSDEDMEVTQRQGEMQWVAEISRTIEEKRFSLYYQSISTISKPHSEPEYYELLLRMHAKDGTIILPGAFLPAAERYNQIENIDKYVVNYLIRYLSQSTSKQSFGINISGASISNEHFLGYVVDLINNYDINCEQIVFEITESIIISDINRANEFITKLRELGCRFALDDFGMGLSSLEYLKHLQVDYIKIDGYFVRDIINDPIDREIVRSINQVCQIMGVKSIAEFVETEEIYDELHKLGVDFIQGYWVSKPQPLLPVDEEQNFAQHYIL